MIDHFTSLLLDLPIGREFKRIKNNMELSSVNIPYTITYVDMMIKYFEFKEDFERCSILLKYKNSRNNHDTNYR